jgi:hypothetical protein
MNLMAKWERYSPIYFGKMCISLVSDLKDLLSFRREFELIDYVVDEATRPFAREKVCF